MELVGSGGLRPGEIMASSCERKMNDTKDEGRMVESEVGLRRENKGVFGNGGRKLGGVRLLGEKGRGRWVWSQRPGGHHGRNYEEH